MGRVLRRNRNAMAPYTLENTLQTSAYQQYNNTNQVWQKITNHNGGILKSIDYYANTTGASLTSYCRILINGSQVFVGSNAINASKKRITCICPDIIIEPTDELIIRFSSSYQMFESAQVYSASRYELYYDTGYYWNGSFYQNNWNLYLKLEL